MVRTALSFFPIFRSAGEISRFSRAALASLVFLPSLFACTLPLSGEKYTTPTNLVTGWNKNLRVEGVAYDIYLPPRYRGRNLLVLPGWKFPKEDWIRKSPLLSYAERHGYLLILPEMHTTLYASRYYPETKLKWNPVPGGEFLRKHLFPALQKRHSLLLPGEKNYLLGLSTGGRGVALIALEHPGLFRAGAALSGDFAQEKMPHDRLMTLLYGPFEKFPERWTGRDNPRRRAKEWSMPLYLAHGKADRVVPGEQSRLFYEALIRENKGELPVFYRAVEGAGHDYDFWGGELPGVFHFFETGKRKKDS